MNDHCDTVSRWFLNSPHPRSGVFNVPKHFAFVSKEELAGPSEVAVNPLVNSTVEIRVVFSAQIQLWKLSATSKTLDLP
jgi:hypothetical protein